jgi:uncharacterized membrane protein
MQNKAPFAYILIGHFIAFMSYFILISSFSSFFRGGFSPQVLLTFFMAFAAAAYAFCSSYFRTRVLQRGEVIAKKWKEWIKANAVVAFLLGSLLVIVASLVLFFPQVLQPFLPKEMLDLLATSGAKTAVGIQAAYGLCLVIHIIWSFQLLNRHRQFFQ